MTAYSETLGRMMASLPRNEITTGNLLSIASTFIVVGGLVWKQSEQLESLRGTDILLASKIDRLEERQKQTDSDHDLLIAIRTELRQIRVRVESLAPPRVPFNP